MRLITVTSVGARTVDSCVLMSTEVSLKPDVPKVVSSFSDEMCCYGILNSQYTTVRR